MLAKEKEAYAMRATYNMIRPRRDLVHAIEEITGTESEYQFVPTCAYTIGDITVDKEGGVICEDEEKLKKVAAALEEKGFHLETGEESGEQTGQITGQEDTQEKVPEIQQEAETMNVPETEMELSREAEPGALEDAANDTEQSMAAEPEAEQEIAPENETGTVPETDPDAGSEADNAAKQESGNDGIPEGENAADPEVPEVRAEESTEVIADKEPQRGDGETPSSEDTDVTALTISMPLDAVNVANLTNLISSRESLIRKALGISDTGIRVREDKVEFPWFDRELQPDEAEAYMLFITHLCKFSKKLKRASGRPVETDNEKFAFRTWLLRMDFIGPEYKAARKILLRNLTGSSAFRNGAPAKEKGKEEERREEPSEAPAQEIQEETAREMAE